MSALTIEPVKAILDLAIAADAETSPSTICPLRSSFEYSMAAAASTSALVMVPSTITSPVIGTGDGPTGGAGGQLMKLILSLFHR